MLYSFLERDLEDIGGKYCSDRVPRKHRLSPNAELHHLLRHDASVIANVPLEENRCHIHLKLRDDLVPPADITRLTGIGIEEESKIIYLIEEALRQHSAGQAAQDFAPLKAASCTRMIDDICEGNKEEEGKGGIRRRTKPTRKMQVSWRRSKLNETPRVLASQFSGERRSVIPASLATVGIQGIPKRGADSHECIVPGRGEGEVGLRLRHRAAESAPAAARLDMWKQNMITPLKDILVHLLLNGIINFQMGDDNNIKHVYRGVVQSFVSVQEYKKRNNLKLYEDIFEKPYLETCGERYKVEASRLLQECNVGQYLENVWQRLEEERQRCSMFLHESLAAAHQNNLVATDRQLPSPDDLGTSNNSKPPLYTELNDDINESGLRKTGKIVATILKPYLNRATVVCGQTGHLAPKPNGCGSRSVCFWILAWNHYGKYRWLAGFLRDLPFPHPMHSGAALYSLCFTLICSQDLDSAPFQPLSSLYHIYCPLFFNICPLACAGNSFFHQHLLERSGNSCFEHQPPLHRHSVHVDSTLPDSKLCLVVDTQNQYPLVGTDGNWSYQHSLGANVEKQWTMWYGEEGS
ncbi:hypothetical protein PR048_012033 [Dryococelus australis]|uniref:Cullin N-terminal domain-containing protein n=1 Tax=Dryococelus australis TaxID=614101 RepID=A0ABQ9HN93_9NEOP|nr:hypothetical protein PR048_012033 [Dryococelus australis]